MPQRRSSTALEAPPRARRSRGRSTSRTRASVSNETPTEQKTSGQTQIKQILPFGDSFVVEAASPQENLSPRARLSQAARPRSNTSADPTLYVCFTPQEAINLSRIKLFRPRLEAIFGDGDAKAPDGNADHPFSGESVTPRNTASKSRRKKKVVVVG